MAERLKRENDIVTLKVELAPGDRVSCVLQFLDGGRLHGRALWEGPIAAFGIDCRQMSLAPRWDEVAYVLPDGLRDALARGLADAAALAPWREPALWVHLVKPYGALRFVPWERLLPEAADLPVLMLPDFIFPPPRRSASGLDIALCASAPLHCEDHHVFDAMCMAIEAILDALQAQAPRLHLFTDRDMADRLRGGPALPDNVLLHDPLQAAPFVVDDPGSRLHDRTGSLRSPWLLWMREALRAYSVDVAHFVCHGHLSGQSGAMLFAQSPLARTDNYLAGPVGATELGSFMTQVGAWSTVFSPPRDNHAPAGVRALADEIAQTLPGPMLLHDGVHGTPADLAQGYRFVHVDAAQSPPHSRGLYLYCQPYLLAEDRGMRDTGEAGESIRERIGHYARNDAQRTAPMPTQTPTPTPTPAIAATERFAEKVQLQYQTLMRDDVVSHEIAARDMAASMETIDLIRQAVNHIEQQRLASDIEARLDRIELGAIETGPLPTASIEIGTIATDTIETGIAAPSRVDAWRAAEGSRETALKEVDAALVQLQALQADAASLPALSMQDVSMEDLSMQDASIEPTAVAADLEARTLRIKDELLAQALRESPGDGLETGR